jgi:HEPN domain-containing protein
MIAHIEHEWRQVFERFEDTERDARAATEAYALNLNDACVFHSMMVLERGLTALAKAVGEETRRNTWGKIIERIERALSKQRENLALYAAAAKEFTYFKEAWRNHVAHARADYDEHEALKVLTHVRDFMSRISHI